MSCPCIAVHEGGEARQGRRCGLGVRRRTRRGAEAHRRLSSGPGPLPAPTSPPLLPRHSFTPSVRQLQGLTNHTSHVSRESLALAPSTLSTLTHPPTTPLPSSLNQPSPPSSLALSPATTRATRSTAVSPFPFLSIHDPCSPPHHPHSLWHGRPTGSRPRTHHPRRRSPLPRPPRLAKGRTRVHLHRRDAVDPQDHPPAHVPTRRDPRLRGRRGTAPRRRRRVVRRTLVPPRRLPLPLARSLARPHPPVLGLGVSPDHPKHPSPVLHLARPRRRRPGRRVRVCPPRRRHRVRGRRARL